MSGFATSDSSNKAQLISAVGANIPQKIKVRSSGIGKPSSNTKKKFQITVSKSGTTPVFKQSNVTYTVSYAQLSKRIQNIQKTGGKILSISEV